MVNSYGFSMRPAHESCPTLAGQRYIIIHGTKGSPQGNWFPWLAATLRHRGASVIIPQLPTPEGQSLERWHAAFAAQVPETAHEHSCCIGHSLGATFLLRYLERAHAPIGCAVFVAPLIAEIGNSEYDQLNRTFIDQPYEWERIKRNAGRVVCLAGDNDPYVPLHQPRKLAAHLAAPLQIVPGGGHLNSESGYNAFELLLGVLLGESAR